MYPSGPWRGYWEQAYYGRQLMDQLHLKFSPDGQITGEGTDLVGVFIFRGQFDAAGNVVMVKQYLGQHEVLYRGHYDGEGTILGEWSIGPEWRGAFALTPDKFEIAEDAPIQSIRPQDS